MVFTDLAMEPEGCIWQEVIGEVLPRGGNKASNGRLDVRAPGFWAREQSAFFDVRVCHPNADSCHNLTSKQIYKLNENDKSVFTRLQFLK